MVYRLFIRRHILKKATCYASATRRRLHEIVVLQ